MRYIRYPNPRRIITKGSSELSQSLEKVYGTKNDALFTQPSLSLNLESSSQGKGRGLGRVFKKKAQGGTHTLLTTNPTKDKKHNEYFGGDSTVALAGEEGGSDE